MIDEPNQPLISARLSGQIGNQLFITAAALSYSWDYNAKPLFPDLNREELRLAYNRDHLFFRLNSNSAERTLVNVYREKEWYRWEQIPFKKDMILEGYFQSWKYFNHYRSKILSMFSPLNNVSAYLNEKFNDLINNPNTVGVHVRTQERRKHDLMIHPFLGLEYFRRAMNRFPSDAIFVIFSDRIGWCRRHFPSLDRKLVFIEGNSGVEDLFLMSLMQHNIICNSTFSWWGAYLNQREDKRVIAPELWGGDPPAPLAPKDLLLPEWEIISSLPLERYPVDMELFKTQSCDNY